MQNKIVNIPLYFLVFLLWMCNPAFAQTEGAPSPNNPQTLSPGINHAPFSPAQNISPLRGEARPADNRNAGQAAHRDEARYDTDANVTGGRDREQLREVQDLAVQAIKERDEEPSSIEAAFHEIASGVEAPGTTGDSLGRLRQFGYSLFRRNITTFAPIRDIPVGPDYVLGPGDELRITLWGNIENTYVQTVDNHGRIYLPTIGPVRVWGLTFSQAETLIRKHLSQYYTGFETSVTMGYLRTIKVYVVGEVDNPGAYNISSLSTLVNALYAAGGPSINGTLREIKLIRNHRKDETFDFYDLLLHGDKSRDFRLESGDVIFVPPIGPVAGIMGQIRRPAIYELKEPLPVREFIEMAGGQMPQSYLRRVQIIRMKPNAEREIIDIDLTSNDSPQDDRKIQNGDLLIMHPSDHRIYNTFTLEGQVKHPGKYEAKPGMQLSDLLQPDAILPTAYLERIEIVRFAEDLKADIFHINLRELWDGDASQDLKILSGDRIFVRSKYRPSGTVYLGGEFKLPGSYTIEHGERLSSVIKRAGGFTDMAYLKGSVFTRLSAAARERVALEDFIHRFEENILEEARQPIFGYSPGLALRQQEEISRRRQQIRALAERITLGRIVIHLDTPDRFEGSDYDIILEDGDRLTVPLRPAEVFTIGSLRNPAAFVHKSNENIQYYINRSGGFTKSADRKEIYLIKADGSAVVGFLKLRDIDPGDAIVVPPKHRMKDLSWITQLTSIASNTAITAASLAVIATR
ncbi:MAG: SLBB domain-containing protein [Candidatus Loosdrechtia sp.]|uniref:SLBB domain-containing protein n=1 Tax=Candidatus Loosdrechtia sp. TaxID=3101272 RepID=UPI003A726274|nr:MAG: SLBB domain-containing protein [Candidatus Jettenia sp. AMX2]